MSFELLFIQATVLLKTRRQIKNDQPGLHDFLSKS